MTPTERARRYHDRRKARQQLAPRDPATASLVSLFDELRECVGLGEVDEIKALCGELVRRVESRT